MSCLGGHGCDYLNLGLQQLKLPKKPVCYTIPGSTTAHGCLTPEGDWK